MYELPIVLLDKDLEEASNKMPVGDARKFPSILHGILIIPTVSLNIGKFCNHKFAR